MIEHSSEIDLAVVFFKSPFLAKFIVTDDCIINAASHLDCLRAQAILLHAYGIFSMKIKIKIKLHTAQAKPQKMMNRNHWHDNSKPNQIAEEFI